MPQRRISSSSAVQNRGTRDMGKDSCLYSAKTPLVDEFSSVDLNHGSYEAQGYFCCSVTSVFSQRPHFAGCIKYMSTNTSSVPAVRQNISAVVAFTCSIGYAKAPPPMVFHFTSVTAPALSPHASLPSLGLSALAKKLRSEPCLGYWSGHHDNGRPRPCENQ